MLQNTVNRIDDLRLFKNTADHMSSTMGKALSYDEYITLLLSAASAHDGQFKPKKVKRQVMLHYIHYDSDDYEHKNEASFDIDCPVSTIQAFATNFCPPGTSKPNSTKVRMASNK
jgi:hypothetical protein